MKPIADESVQMNETRRQSIARALRGRPKTVMEISRQLGIPIKLALADIEHIRRSLRGGYAGEKLQVRESAPPPGVRIKTLIKIELSAICYRS